ncbi:MAG: methyltransferase domain-containing protein [Bacteroidales bacterium]|nr:methyltransferase domain-containing protein [Bacteroidales bacterium]MCF8458959.1 methyltransferase domain-containing protein [Bacteroidales bacterium]
MDALFYDIFYEMERQGPGDKTSTLKALGMIPDLPGNTTLLDVGCGTGIQSIHLAEAIEGEIFAVDNYQPFIEKLNKRAEKLGLSGKLSGRQADMFNLPFQEMEFDVIWSEGAVYIMGLEKAMQEWAKFLKDEGCLVVSDFNFLAENPPEEVYNYFAQEVPDAGTVEKTIEFIRKSDFRLINRFTLPTKAWEDFYEEQEKILIRYRNYYQNNKEAIEIIDAMQYEIDLYREYSKSYGYTFYILQKKVVK